MPTSTVCNHLMFSSVFNCHSTHLHSVSKTETQAYLFTIWSYLSVHSNKITLRAYIQINAKD